MKPHIWVLLRRIIIFILGILPFSLLLWRVFHQDFLGDPAKEIVWATGHWAIRFLLITLSVALFVRYFRWRWLMTHRRMLGLFSLFYACLHLLSYYQFILGGNLVDLGRAIIERPYILAGAPALVILILLGITSTKGWMKRLGKRWQSLHRYVYLAAFLAWIHVFWQVRSSYFDAVLYGFFTIGLLSFRLPLLYTQWRRWMQ